MLVRCLCMCVLGWGISINAQPSANENYVLSRSFLSPVSEDSAMPALSDRLLNQAGIQYIDGFGRRLQHQDLGATPTGANLISLNEYDRFGRSPVTYLPYASTGPLGSFRPNAVDEQDIFYEPFNWPDLYPNDLDAPFAVKEFDGSPLQRVVEEGANGAAWQPDRDTWGHSTRLGHTQRRAWRPNLAGEVAYFPANAGAGFHLSQSYGAGELWVREYTDENGFRTLIFSDTWGKKILEKAEIEGQDWAETYYVYDDFDRLVCILQPEGTARLLSNNASGMMDSVLEEYCYQYRYDVEGNMVEKKMPGSAWRYFVYGSDGRLLLSQDGNLRDHKQWRFFKYDALGRKVQEGLLEDARSRLALQAQVDGQIWRWEKEDGGPYGYSNRSFPDVSNARCELLIIRFFDHHDLNRDGDMLDAWESFSPSLLLPHLSPLMRERGLQTAEKVRVLGSSDWLWESFWYNEKGHLIQRNGQNQLGGKDCLNRSYTFAGDLKEEHLLHSSPSDSVQIYQRLEYDDQRRLIRHWHDLKRGHGSWTPDPVLLSQKQYDELGRIAQDAMLSFDQGGQFLQEVDLRYNLRNWLTDINEVATTCGAVLSGDGGDEEPIQGQNYRQGAGINGGGDLFGLKINYDRGIGMQAAAFPQFTGNISGLQWQHVGNCPQGYAFSYDGLDRIREAWYAERGNHKQWTQANKYNGQYEYDKNGNLRSLNRRGLIGSNPASLSSYGDLDLLTYTYEGNRLTKVEDGVGLNPPPGVDQFQDGAQLAREYAYDPSGNVSRDANRGIDSIWYTPFHKPALINLSQTASPLEYGYSASGRKLSREWGNSSTHYVGEFTYEDGVLSQIACSGGRIVITGTGPEDFDYQGFLKDHLGNVRVVFAEGNGEAVVVQRDDYYPYGMNHAGLGQTVASPENLMRYNGVESQPELDNTLYDTPFRTLDVSLGSWWQQDPVTEGFEANSPYNSNLNNPILLNDPQGDCPRCAKVLLKILWKSGRKGRFDFSAIVDMGQDAYSVLAPSSSLLERGEGVFNLISPLDTREIKSGYKMVNRWKKSRKANPDELPDHILNRGDTRPPEEIFENGFKAKGDNRDYNEHVWHNPDDTYYISTSKSEEVARGFTSFEGYVYKIKNNGKGIDANKHFKEKNPYPREMEVSFPKEIPRENIMGAYQVRLHEVDYSTYLPNPHYKP